MPVIDIREGYKEGQSCGECDKIQCPLVNSFVHFKGLIIIFLSVMVFLFVCIIFVLLRQ